MTSARLQYWPRFKLQVLLYVLVTFTVYLVTLLRPKIYGFSAFGRSPFQHVLSSDGLVEMSILLGFILPLALFFSNRLILSILTLIYLYFSVANFTALGAFSSFVGICLLFLICFDNVHPTVASWTARTMLGVIFLIAAFHKINPAFLAGYELSGGDFFNGTRPAMRPLLKAMATPFISGLVIFVEGMIGTLCLARVPLAGIFVLLFILGLCVFQPPVATVYFALLPFVMLGFPELSVGFRRFFRNWKSSALIMLTIFSVTLPMVWAATPLYVGLMSIYCAVAFAVSAAFLNGPAMRAVARRSFRQLRWQNLSSFKHFATPAHHKIRGATWIAACCVYGFLPFLMAVPEPFSFTMFSARNVSSFSKLILSEDPQFCRDVGSRFSFRWVGALHWEPSGKGCTIEIHWPSVYQDFMAELCVRPLLHSADALCGRTAARTDVDQ